MYRVPTGDDTVSSSSKPLEYIVPVTPPINNPDERTLELIERNQETTSMEQTGSMGVTVNQTTAIRIDDSRTHQRESWSSKKISEFFGEMGRVSIGTVESWASEPTFVPERGMFIVYMNRSVINNIEYPGVKIGDGNAYVADLPFAGDDVANNILAQLNLHANDTNIHVTSAEKQFWNNKLNYVLDGEVLEFTTN